MQKEQIGDCTLYCGDCMEVMPSLGLVSAVVTDPPYGMAGKLTASGNSRWTKHFKSESHSWDASTVDKALQMAVAIAKANIVWGGQFYSLPPSRCWLVWNKIIRNWSSSEAELAWTTLDKPNRVFDYSHGQLASEGKHFHPTQKPVPLMKWCIEQLPDGCHTIFDPFMGSGSTLVACALLGRKGIGVEMEAQYFDSACKRIEDAYKQGDMFIEPVKVKAEQLVMV